MQALFDKWNQFQSNKKMHRLWNEYKKAARLGDRVLKSEKLNSFLAQFKGVALDYLERQKTNPKLEKLFTEIAELLSILIEQISNFDEKATRTPGPDLRSYFKNVLQSVDVILKDPTYREQLQSSTVLMTQFVAMLDNIEDAEAKMILIKLLGILGKNLESRIVIGQNEGFKKLLVLMLEQNEDLLQGIIETFKQILDINYEKEQEYMMSTATAPTKLCGDIGSVSPEEIRSIFDKDEDECSPGGNRKRGLAIRQENDPASRLSYRDLNRLSKEVQGAESGHAARGRASDGKRVVGTGREGRSRMTCVTLFKNYESEKAPFEESKGSIVAEEMVLQGALNTVCEVLLTTRRDLQIDLMHIIAKLLLRSPHNQAEFRNIEGYYVLALMLNQKRDHSVPNERKYLRVSMGILKKIIFDEDESRVVQNSEAFKVLLSLISSSPQLMTVQEAVRLLSEILAANIRNSLIFLKMMGFVDLHVLLLRLLFKESEYEGLGTMDIGQSAKPHKLTSLFKFHYHKTQEAVKEGKGEGSTEEPRIISESFITAHINEKERLELFTEVDQLIMSLSLVLNPLHIFPCANVYAQILSIPGLHSQFFKCLLDRLEIIVYEKLTKVDPAEYEAMYSPDLEMVLSYLGTTLQNIAGLHSVTSVAVQESFANILEVFHRYLLFASALQHYSRPEESGQQLAQMKIVDTSPKNNLALMFERNPRILEFLYSLTSSAFCHNPFYTEILYSMIGSIVTGSLPCPPVMEFLNWTMSNCSRLRYQDFVMLDFVFDSRHVAEAVYSFNPPTHSMESVFDRSGVKEKLQSFFLLYCLCKRSSGNKSRVQLQLHKALEGFSYAKLNEQEQHLLLSMVLNLVTETPRCEVDLPLLVPHADAKDVELSLNIRNEVRGAYYSLTLRPAMKETASMIQPIYSSNFLNLFLLLLVESSPATQSRMLEKVVEEVEESPAFAGAWVHMELMDTLLEVYDFLSSSGHSLGSHYLKLMQALMKRGVGLTKLELLHKLSGESPEFQGCLNNCLRHEQFPLSLVVDRGVGTEPGFIYTLPLKYFPKERTGFTVHFWARFRELQRITTLFEFTGSNDEVLISFNYVVAHPLPARANSSSSSSMLQESESFAKSKEDPAALSKDEIKYILSVETEGTINRVELKFPLLEEHQLTHVVIHYSKTFHFGYFNGKLIYSTKQGSLNPYPPALAKGVRMRLSNSPKELSMVSVFEGSIDYKTVQRIYSKGPSDEVWTQQRDLGIELGRVYKFPRPARDKDKEAWFEKLVLDQFSPQNAHEDLAASLIKVNTMQLSGYARMVQAQYISQLKYLPESEYLSPNTKGAKSNDLFEVQGSTTCFHSYRLTLKDFLSTPEFARVIISKLCTSQEELKSQCSSSELSNLLHILELMLIRNDKFAGILPQVSSTLLYLAHARRSTSVDWKADHSVLLDALFNLLCNDFTAMQKINTYTKPDLLMIPIVHHTRLHYFKAIQHLALFAEKDQKECILNVLSNLLLRQENAEKLAGEGLSVMLMHLFTQSSHKSRDSGSFMYEKLLEVFELFFYWPHILDWELLGSFFLYLKNRDNPHLQDVLVDLLSVLSVYIFVSGHRTVLADKFVTVGGIKILFNLMESTKIEVVEHAVKLLSVLLFAHPRLKPMLIKLKYFDVLSHRIMSLTPSFSFLQTLLDTVLGSITVQLLYPQTNSYVSAMINRSPIAKEVVNQAGAGISTITQGLCHAEVLEALFSALSRTKELHYRINMLKQLQTAISGETEGSKAVDCGMFVWIVEYFKLLEQEQAQAEKSAGEVVMESLKKISKMTISILCDMLVLEMERLPKHCRALKILQSIPSVDHIQALIIQRLFRLFCKSKPLKRELDNVIKNLSSVLLSLSLVLNVTDELRLSVIKVVNTVAARNTTEVRSLMKTAGLFDFRDALLLELLNSEVHTASSMHILAQLSLDALASNSKFRDSKTIESLVAALVESGEKEAGLRAGILQLFHKQFCKFPENVAYIGKLVEDSTIASALCRRGEFEASLVMMETYLREKRGDVLKNVEKVLRLAKSQQTERLKQLVRNVQERSTKRNKTFADIAKEKAAVQTAVAEYEAQELKLVSMVGPHLVENRLEELQNQCKKRIEEGGAVAAS